MKIVELILDEEQEDGGIEAISIVESPAIESDFVMLNNQEIKLAEVSKEKKILLGALLIPNKPIFRKGENEEDYYIFFSKDTIQKASQMYLKNGYQNSTTLEHNETLSGLTLVESWLVEDEVQDKSRKYGLNVPVGTWMGAVPWPLARPSGQKHHDFQLVMRRQSGRSPAPASSVRLLPVSAWWWGRSSQEAGKRR